MRKKKFQSIGRKIGRGGPSPLREERRAKVMELYKAWCSKKNPRGAVKEIAKQVGVAYQTVASDIRLARERWIESATECIAAGREKLMAEIQRDIDECREEWLKSRNEDQLETTIEGIPDADGNVKRKKITQRKMKKADTRYLEAVTRMRDQLAKLGDLYGPQKIAPTDPSGTNPYQPEINWQDELTRRIEIIVQRREQRESLNDGIGNG